MVMLVVFLNLFFVPVVSLWVYAKRYNIEPEISLFFLMQYTIFAACNVPLTKVGVVLARILLRWDISIDSGYYTLLAIIAAALLPELLARIQAAYKDRASLFNKVTKMLQKGKFLLMKHSLKYRYKLGVSLCLVALIVIAYIIRKPLEIYVGNSGEFLFTVSDFLPWLLLIAVATLVVVSCLVSLLPDIAFRLVSALLMWFGLASWLQDLFLNKKLSEVNGGAVDWASLGDLQKNNLAIWFVLLFGALLLCVILKQKWFSFARILAGWLCIVQLVAVGTVFINIPEKDKPEIVISGDQQMQLASEENVIIFVVDYLSTNVILNTLECYSEASNIVKDFVSYDNVGCDYYCTFPSFTHFLTGNDLDFDVYVEDWQQESWESERCKKFYQRLKKNGYTCRLNFETASVFYIFGEIENLVGKFDNIQESGMHTDTSLLLQKLLKLSVYCCLPYTAKPSFEVLTSDFADVVVPIDVQTPIVGNTKYLEELRNQGLSVNATEKKLFTVNYLGGLHPPYTLNSEGDFVDSSTPVETMRGLFVIFEEYFDQLKSLGLYDSSTIIIMGDHGDGTPEGFQPAFLLKKANETKDNIETNSAPVDYNDFQATILELVGQKDESFGKSFFDWNEGEERYRVIYARVQDDNAPSVKGSPWNLYAGYVFYWDAEELCNHIINDEPDIIEVANKWRTSPW